MRHRSGSAINCESQIVQTVTAERRQGIAGDAAFITVKGLTVGATRKEFEYAIPVADAEEMLDSLCEPHQIDKTRYCLNGDGVTFEIDEFRGDNAGLVIAEVELKDQNQGFAPPEWLVREVTDDPRYFNSNLAHQPVSRWPADR